MERESFYSAVRAFLSGLLEERERDRVLVALREDDDLYRLGLVDSLTIIRMIIFVEELTAKEIDLEDHDFESFYTLRGLYSVVETAADEG